MQTIQNSAFKEKAAPVVDVSKLLPEAGAVVLNKLDGRLYAADKYGWHRFGDPYSIINLFVDFNGTDQFSFTFRAPLGSTLTFHDGDGTVTDVSGNDATSVIHTTNYSTPGVYYFTVSGDVQNMTYIEYSNNAPITGDISTFERLLNLDGIAVGGTDVYGSINGFGALTGLTVLLIWGTNIDGDIGNLSPLVNMDNFSAYSTFITGDVGSLATFAIADKIILNGSGVYGDIAALSVITTLTRLYLYGTKAHYKTVAALTMTGVFLGMDCNWTPAQVDNALESFVNLTGCTINIGGNNAPRTSASDAAFAIVDAANTLTVNS